MKTNNSVIRTRDPTNFSHFLTSHLSQDEFVEDIGLIRGFKGLKLPSNKFADYTDSGFPDFNS